MSEEINTKQTKKFSNWDKYVYTIIMGLNQLAFVSIYSNYCWNNFLDLLKKFENSTQAFSWVNGMIECKV